MTEKILFVSTVPLGAAVNVILKVSADKNHLFRNETEAETVLSNEQLCLCVYPVVRHFLKTSDKSKIFLWCFRDWGESIILYNFV